MKPKKLDKKIIDIYINHAKSPRIKRKKINFNNDTNNYLITKYELINHILNKKMNLICFDCRKKSPKYISINNAIFLCQNCAKIHKKIFPEKISLIIENNLNLLSIKYLRYMCHGGNQNLDNFINYIFPGLQNYPPEILYRTQALNYYRENLKYKMKEGPEPKCPNELKAYKIVSEKGLINIRDKIILFNNNDNDTENMNNNYNKTNTNDIVNNYFNNYNNTYNTYNSISISNQKPKEKTTGLNIGTSLSNKEFFNEMKNLFGKRYIKAIKKSFSINKKLTAIKSFKNLSKVKLNKINDFNKNNKNKPLTFRLNESLNYSFAKTKEGNKNSFKNLNLNTLNKSTLSSIIRDKTPKNLGNNFFKSNKYIKPNVNNIKKNYGINVKYIENRKLKKIYNNKNKFNNIIQQKNVLKYFKIQKKNKSLFKNKEDTNNNNIPIINNNNNKNLKLNCDTTDNSLLKEKIFHKINKSKDNLLYLNTDYSNICNNIPLQKVLYEKNIVNNNNKITCYNNFNKKNKILVKENNNNITFDGFKNNIRIPIKVNLKNNLERKKQILKNKNIELDTLNNNKMLFKSKQYNYDFLTNNILFLNNSNIS